MTEPERHHAAHPHIDAARAERMRIAAACTRGERICGQRERIRQRLDDAAFLMRFLDLMEDIADGLEREGIDYKIPEDVERAKRIRAGIEGVKPIARRILKGYES